jgi:hypothetical protein
MHIAGLLAVVLALQAAVMYGQQSTTREDRWRQDLDFYATTIKQTHPQPFANLPAEEFDGMVRELSGQVGTLTDLQVLLGMNRIASRMGDGHTSVAALPGVRLFSIRLQWLADGWYVVDAGSTNLRMLGRKLTRIAGLEIAQVEEMASGVFPHENDSAVKALAGTYLVSPELLQGIGALESNTAPVEYEFLDADGGPVTHTVQVDGTALFSATRKARPAVTPLHRRSGTYYWFEYLEADKTLYIQYNVCQQDPALPMRTFVEEMLAALAGKTVDRVVIDLRNNRGGNSAVTTQLLEALREAQNAGVVQVKQSFAIISRFTFSSGMLAALELRATGQVKLVGEIPANRPSHFGEARGFLTPNLRIPFTVSTRQFRLGDGDLVPDMPVEQTIDDYRNEVDPYLETILKQ